MKILDSTAEGFEAALEGFLSQRHDEMDRVEGAVREIIEAVKSKGDEAVLGYTHRFDGVRLSQEEMDIPPQAWDWAWEKADGEILGSLQRAADRIETFHRQQIVHSWFDTQGGMVRGQVVRPLARAGVYVPGGKAAYPSSLLMNVIPARVAGVKEVVMMTPPSQEGINPYILVAAKIAGVDRVLLAGGAQAIAALAYGTESVPRADIIVGPGNIYVAAAKRLLFGVVQVDMVAGPSEILIISDGSPSPAFIAADLLSQAEHDELAWSILVTTSEEFSRQVDEEMQRMATTLPRHGIIEASLQHHGLIILVRDLEQGFQIANRIAPEHLELALPDPFQWVGAIENAGAVFLGAYTPEAVGDYLAGPNHVLPTGGTARFFSALGTGHFLKRTNLLSVTPDVLGQVSEDVARLARLEGLEAHARAVEIRGKCHDVTSPQSDQ